MCYSVTAPPSRPLNSTPLPTDTLMFACPSSNVARNNFSGSLPTSIYTLTSLQEMDVSENSLTGSLPLSASALSGLQMLNMVNNRFSGELPTTLGNLTSLTRVELGRNYFTGSLPTSLGQLTALISLGLQGNTLGGSIPSQLGALISLNTLDVSNNQFWGALPATPIPPFPPTFPSASLPLPLLLPTITRDESNNQFWGALPQTSSTTSSGALFPPPQSPDVSNNHDLSNNQLRGALPATLGNLSSLTDLKIGGTDLTCPSAAGHPPCGVWQDASSEFCQTCPAFCTNCSTAALPPKPAAAAPTSPAPAPPAAAAASLSTPRQGFIIGIAVGAAALLLLLGALGIYLCPITRAFQVGPLMCRRYSQLQVKSICAPLSSLHPPIPPLLPCKPEAPPIPSQILMCRRYSLDQVKKATGGWAEANHIGTGGYGEGMKLLAVECTVVGWDGLSGECPFVYPLVVEEMATKSHPHLVRLLGYCVDMDMTTEHHEQIVIYEFCANGDLEKYLNGGFGVPRCAAIGGDNAEAGHSLAELNHIRTSLCSPVCHIPHRSYGVLLLEVITLKPVILSIDGGQFNIKDWVRPFVEESKVAAFKDPLLPEASDDLILTLAKIGLQCTALPASSRPPMSEVSRKLESLKREHFHSSGMDGRDPSDVDQRLAKIDQELDRRAESGLSIQAEFVRLNIMSESGEYIKENEISAASGGYSNRSSGVILLQSQEISQEFCQEIPSGR
ncbi:unnamed protein product [Closterium sp. NIES-64]|nr:unnamed protein product [Closterium sp. NIES-64]